MSYVGLAVIFHSIFKLSKTLHTLHRRRKVEEPPMNSATKEVSDSGSSDNEPLSMIKTSLHHTRVKTMLIMKH